MTKFCMTAWVFSLGAFLFPACQGVYYDMMEEVGFLKRDILVDRVESARDSQLEAKEQFRDALDQFSSVVHFQGGDLEETYRKLSRELEQCASRAEEVRTRIERVESVAGALFEEWASELQQYTSRNLRDASERRLAETRERYRRLMVSMKRAEKAMGPVLRAFQDQVLFLKHNLNARAIAGIQQEAAHIEADVERLIRDMEGSIAEADAFIGKMASAPVIPGKGE